MHTTASRVILLFGATGDLAREKLYPALNALSQYEPITVIGLGRRYKDHAEFVEKEGLPLQSFTYVRFDITEHDASDLHAEISRRCSTDSLSLTSYLSLPPTILPETLDVLNELHELLANEYDLEKAAVVEKPFGHDKASAADLEAQLREDYEDHEIFRIDHYLGKTFVLNLLSLRFQNDLIASVWNRNAIDSIQIIVDEDQGIEGREGYYAQMGVLKDMIQNHVLQIAALLTMEAPVSFSADDIASAKHDALRRMRITDAVFGRYQGLESGRATAMAAKLELEGPMDGVPIYVRSGKKFDSRHATVVVRFSQNCTVCGSEPPANELQIQIQPEMRIELALNVKRTGEDFTVDQKRFDYNHSVEVKDGEPSAYERIFRRIIARDRLIFPTYEEIERQWEIVALEEPEPFVYRPGMVPDEFHAFIRRDGREWRH